MIHFLEVGHYTSIELHTRQYFRAQEAKKDPMDEHLGSALHYRHGMLIIARNKRNKDNGECVLLPNPTRSQQLGLHLPSRCPSRAS
jgi:hypothetical protein